MQLTQIKIFSFFFALSLGATGVLAQPSFSLKTNSDFPAILGTDFGYKVGRFQPYLGVSNYHIRTKYQETYSADPTLNYSSEFSATVFITSLGARYAFRDNGLLPYGYANVYKLFTTVDDNGFNTNELEDQLSPFGFGVGFGAEYTVSKNLAVFGEYGFRALFPGSDNTEPDPFIGGTVHTEVSDMFSALNGSAGIRFYF